MTREEVLRQALKKAADKGWDLFEYDDFAIAKASILFSNKHSAELCDPYSVIFNHEFARAFWNWDETDQYSKLYGWNWQYHLQQMVLEEDPIKYLEKFL